MNKHQYHYGPCPHPGTYHLSNDGLSIVRPHPGANSCFAREQGYVIAKIEPFYKDLGPAMVSGLNGAVEAKKREETAKELDDEGDHEAAMLTRMGR